MANIANQFEWKPCLILAGGLGTRLRPVVKDVPKCLAPINGEPFIDLLIQQLIAQGINKFVFCVGFGSEQVISHINGKYPFIDKSFSEEESPLGTGGAIMQGLKYLDKDDPVVVLNGDTFAEVNYSTLTRKVLEVPNALHVSLFKVTKPDRFSVAKLSETNDVSFSKKNPQAKTALINAGVYSFRPSIFAGSTYPNVFSFEDRFLHQATSQVPLKGTVFKGQFLDIGVPKDYKKAQILLKDRSC